MADPAEIERRFAAALVGEGFLAVLRQAPAAIFVKDREGCYRFVNSAWEEITGIPRDRAIGLDDLAVFGPEAARVFRANDEAVWTGGTTIDREETTRFRGVRRTYRSLKFPLRDAAGEVIAVAGISVEITEAREVETALRESEDRLRRALLGAAWPVMVHDRAGRVLLVNEAWLDAAGMTADQLTSVDEWLRRAHGERWQEVRALLRRLLDGGERGMGAEVEVHTARGARIWDFVSSPLGRIGGEPAMVSMALDVTERKRAEAELRRREEELGRVFTTSPDLLGIGGFDGYYRRINPAYATLHGLTEEECLTRPILSMVHPDDRARTADALRSLETGTTLTSFAIRCLQRDRGFRWVSWNASPVAGAPLFVAVGRDVTEERARAEFEEQLIGIVSHDLKNPLLAIDLAATALLRRGESLDEKTLRAASRIHSSADSALKLIRDLLDFTRARLGAGIPVRPEPVDLHRLVRDAVDEVLAGFPDREVEVRQAGAGEGEWDPGRVGQVVKNLLVNALKYSAPGSRVRVCSRAVDDDVEVDVWNEGPPIPAEELPHLFEPMRRGRATGPGGGAGLGLFIVDRLVRAHGGRVFATSSADEGTRFVVRLPRRSAATA